MTTILDILLVAAVSGVATSTFSSAIHKMRWHRAVRKTESEICSLFVSNIYQFNRRFFCPYSVVREIIINIIILNIIYLLFCTPDRQLGAECLLYSFLFVFLFRVSVITLLYAKFYDDSFFDF